jgi:uncharacterized protein
MTFAIGSRSSTSGPQGELDEFNIGVGPLPTDVDAVEFEALQTYSNGDVVRRVERTEAGKDPPDDPAPRLQLTAPAKERAATRPPRHGAP